LSVAPDDRHPPDGEPPIGDPLAEVWGRLARPFDVNTTIGALIGMPPIVVAELVGLVVATSPEADALLEQFPRTIRSLATSMHSNAERCLGTLRGPVLWSETVSARASSFGDEGLYVCATPSRAYDIDENRVLVAALVHVRDAAKAAGEGHDVVEPEDDRFLRAKHNGFVAGRLVGHPSLRGVTHGQPTRRAVKRARSGRHHGYRPALDMLARAAEPVGPDDLRPWCDERTRAQLRALMGVVHRLEATGGTLPPFRAEQGGLYAGPVQYFHPRSPASPGALSGIVVGSILVDVPDRLHDPSRARAQAALDARAAGRTAIVVMDDADLDAAVERAISLATRSR
jgi:hypothetical protein